MKITQRPQLRIVHRPLNFAPLHFQSPKAVRYLACWSRHNATKFTAFSLFIWNASCRTGSWYNHPVCRYETKHYSLLLMPFFKYNMQHVHCHKIIQLCNGWTCRVVRILPHTKVCEYSLYKTLLMMDRWGPKHVELTQVLNKLTH